MRMAVSLGDGKVIYADQFVSQFLYFGKYRALTFLKVLQTPLAIVLGTPFLRKHNPMIDWRDNTLTFDRRGKQYVVQGSVEPKKDVELATVQMATPEDLEVEEADEEPLDQVGTPILPIKGCRKGKRNSFSSQRV